MRSQSQSASTEKNLLLRSVLSNHAGVVGSICIAFVMSPVMVNTLGDTRYGVWSIMSALGGYMLVLDFGIGSAIARFVARDLPNANHERINRVIGSAFCLYLAFSSFLLLIAPAIAWGLEHFLKVDSELADVIWWLGILTTLDIAISLSSGLMRGTLIGHQRYDVMNAVRLGMSAVVAIVMYGLLSLGYGLIALSLVGTASNIITIVILHRFLRRRYAYLSFDPRLGQKETSRQVVGFGKFSFLSVLAAQFVFYSDAIVIGVFHSVAAVTYYSIATMLIEYANRLIRGVSTAYMPHFSSLESSESKEKMQDQFIAGTRYVLLLSNLLCIGLLVSGGTFIGIWMGPQYADVSGPLVAILLIMQIARGPQLLAYALLHGVGQHATHSYWNMGLAIANLLLSILLVQQYGILGVASATVLTQFVFYGIISPWLSCRYIGVSILSYVNRTFLRALPASIALLVTLVLLLQQHRPTGYAELLIQAAIGTSVYVTVAWFTLLGSAEREKTRNSLETVLRSMGTKLSW